MTACPANTPAIAAWTPWEQPMVIRLGETWDPSMEWTERDPGTGVFSPIDWTGYTAEVVITLPGGVVTLTSGNGGVVLDTGGVMRWLLSSADTTALAASSGSYVAWVVEPDGARRMAGRGPVEVE
jgi:hypothetical protein